MSQLHNLSYLDVARCRGPDADAFLQSQLSADVGALKPGDAAFACYCNPKGQVLGLLLVCRRNEDILLLASRTLLPGILQRLRMYLLRSRVDFDTESGLKVFASNEIPEAGDGETVFRPENASFSYVISPGADEEPGNENEWKQQELEAGIAWLEPATTEKFIPQMLGFDSLGAVSFRKGCYPGQEIVARARYLGKVKRRPVLLRVTGDLRVAPGESVRLEWGPTHAVGTVIDSTCAGLEKTLLFAVAGIEPGTKPERVVLESGSYRCATT